VETRTLEKLLKQKNSQFTWWIVGPVFVCYCALQVFFVVGEITQSKKQLALWKEKNQERIAQSLFLKNDADLKWLSVEEIKEPEPSHSSFSFQVYNQRGQIKYSRGHFFTVSASEIKTAQINVHYLKGEITDISPLLVGERLQGYLVLQVAYQWSRFLKPSLIILSCCIVVFLILKCGVWLWVSTLKLSVVKPVEKMNSEIALKIEELSNLKPLSTDSAEFKYAPTEFISLVKSYNELVANIQKLRAKEIQFATGVAKYELANRVAHDIRSPLAALTLAIENLPPLPDNQKEIFQGVSERIFIIAQDLLDATKKDRAKEMVKDNSKSICELKKVVSEIVQEKQILFIDEPPIQWAVSEIPNIKIVANESELKRAMSNILDNSREALPRGGEIRIKCTETGDKLYLSVKDNGKGIAKELFQKVWEQGFSFDKEKGSGLGLFYVKSVVESWGGRVSLDSALGKGTVISLQLSVFKE